MRAGRFAAAWTISDAVLAARDPAFRDDPNLPYHLRWVWDGTPPDGLRVLVRCYHGLGDTLQFARFLPHLRRRAAHVTLEAPPALGPLLAGIAGVDRLVAFDPAHPLPPSACDVEIMELAHMLRVDAAQTASCVPYLHANPAAIAAARALASRRLALCWQAGAWDPARSIPLPHLLAALPGRRRHVSLQRGPAAAEAGIARFVNPHDADLDATRTATLICAAAHVITVDTMVAHLAGALGRPTTLLLKPDPDWRWPDAGTRSIWYPSIAVRHAAPQSYRI